MQTTIYLLRHGEVSDPEKIEYGRLAGFHMTQNGIQQVQATAQKFLSLGIKPCVIETSPLERARETAQIVSQVLGNLPIKVDERLTEWDQGPWEGKLTEDFYKNSGYYAVPMKMEGLEPHDQAADRVINVVHDLVAECHGQPIFIISHRESMASAILKLQGRDFSTIHDLPMHVASVWELKFEDNQFVSAELKWDTPN
ncbi:MAG: histidine phosphatase family protein [Patescibacteria group bacterium]|nr:histidine phosphatase family protein [Patescibacteria group bacterium]